MKDRLHISVIGASHCGPGISKLAYEVGQEIAKKGHILICGGLGGVMAAACEGAFKTGGTTVGVLPGEDRSAANPYLSVSIVTGCGYGRNYFIALSADAIIAVSGEYGTLSEISYGLKLRRPVVLLESWRLAEMGISDRNLALATSPAEAVALAEAAAMR